MTQRITVVVDGIDDSTHVNSIEKAIRDAFHRAVLPGAWQVVVKPSRVRGRWDVYLQGRDVRHTLSISATAGVLASLLPLRLRESLHRFSLESVEGGLAETHRFPRAV